LVPKNTHAERGVNEAWERSGINYEVAGFPRLSGALDLLRYPTASNFKELFAGEGPKSQWETWDPVVYAGCVNSLGDEQFLWKDVHWHLDKSELLKRAEMWNKALDKYCDNSGLLGEEREQVIPRHKANPCAPCGRVGCDAFEESGSSRDAPSAR
jgi:hypothetical protein